jgi:flagellar biosynthesis/type III secretory pathway chaperone
MTASRILPEIRRLLSEQLEGTRRLNDLLEEEHAALARLESATVEKLAAEKQHELEALEIRERERLRLLAAAGYAPDQAGRVNPVGTGRLLTRISNVSEQTNQ